MQYLNYINYYLRLREVLSKRKQYRENKLLYLYECSIKGTIPEIKRY